MFCCTNVWGEDEIDRSGVQNIVGRRVLIFQEQTEWMAIHGNIDDFVPSWERPEHVVLAPLAQEVLEVSHSEKIWHDRY